MMAERIFLYTPRNRNRFGAPSPGGGRNFGAPSTTRANIGHSRTGNELARTRHFRSKTQFLPNFSPAPRKFWGPLDPRNQSPEITYRGRQRGGKNIRHTYHHCWVYSASTSMKNWKFEFFVNHLWHVDGRGGVPECVISDACSILWVQFVSQNFSHYNESDLRRICARALYDRASLSLNNSKSGWPTAEIFTHLVHDWECCTTLLWNPLCVAPFLRRVPLKTQHSKKVNFLAQIFRGVKFSKGLNSQIPVYGVLRLLSLYACAKLQAVTARDKYRKTFFPSRLTH